MFLIENLHIVKGLGEKILHHLVFLFFVMPSQKVEGAVNEAMNFSPLYTHLVSFEYKWGINKDKWEKGESEKSSRLCL